ncbi:MAG: transcriptional repressor [Bacteroidales bacterium]|nr:transcriptional repressor [Clostridium sp.]MCM1502590.1 transcriptional repressor [Bacteroidales bacterium]
MEHRHVKPTVNRILVLDALVEAGRPVSLQELETIISTMDKSSIFRALTLFLDHDIVHGIEDGSGSLKYEVCHGDDHCSISDMHVHFYCESCHHTFCFESAQIPETQVPEGFLPRRVNYMIKGLCPSCRNKA